ncbi:MAG: hypothetical protein C0506_07050 [Anaerolinea sp.]|nr:hypothetical protein [Anaerolinea sp.]
MKVLILGASDSAGTSLPDPSRSWRAILERELPPLVGEAVEVPHARLYTYVPGSVGFASRQIEAHQPDVVVVAATVVGFAYPTVAGRVRHLSGWRAGRWMERHSQSWEMHDQQDWGRARRRLYRIAQTTARRTIGVAGMSSFEQTLADYEALIERVAREEQIHGIIMGATHPSGAMLASAPDSPALIDRFNTALEAKTVGRRFDWVDRQGMRAALAAEAMLGDGLHKTPSFHRRIADTLLPLLARQHGAGR